MEKSRVELPDKIVKSHAYLISGAFGCHGIGMPVFRIEKSHIRSLQDQEPVGFRDHETLPVRRVAALCQGIQDLLQVAEISIDGQPFELGNGLGEHFLLYGFQLGRTSRRRSKAVPSSNLISRNIMSGWGFSEAYLRTGRHLGLAEASALGGDNDHAVGRTRPVNRGG